MTNPTLIKTLAAAAAVLALLACASGTSNPAAVPFDPATGKHPASWTSSHWSEYLKAPDTCKPCHGSNSDPALSGGTSGVSCFGCHHPNGPHHPAGWAAAGQHGRLGAQAEPNGLKYFQGTGFASCTPCHGSDYTNPVGITPSCKSCHTTAPHAAKPWINTTSATLPNHDQTRPGNAAECAKCHAGGANSSVTPQPPAAAGTVPGCFNGTLCHTSQINRQS